MAAIAIPRLSGFNDTANQSAVEANLRTIDSASMIHEANTGEVAANIAALISADLLQEDPSNDDVTYGLNDDGRGTASFDAGLYGATAAAADATVEEVIALWP